MMHRTFKQWLTDFVKRHIIDAEPEWKEDHAGTRYRTLPKPRPDEIRSDHGE
jgi:hypothetical protein